MIKGDLSDYNCSSYYELECVLLCDFCEFEFDKKNPTDEVIDRSLAYIWWWALDIMVVSKPVYTGFVSTTYIHYFISFIRYNLGKAQYNPNIPWKFL